MATKKLSNYFSSLPASGGFQMGNMPTGRIDPKNNSLGNIAERISINQSGNVGRRINTPPSSTLPAGAPAPMMGAPNAFSGPSPAYGASVFQGATPTATAPTTPASAVDPKWMNADGSFKTPDQIAEEVGGALRSSQEVGDVGALTLEQFGSENKSAEELQADAQRIGNTRNDIAVGEIDPYKIASESGIAYSAAEMKAIENAYAGIYDPALDSALSKLESKQASDAAAAKAAADALAKANEPYTLGKDDVRMVGGNIIGMGIGGGGGGDGIYVPGQNATVDAYIKNNTPIENVPQELRGLVAQGIANKPFEANDYMSGQGEVGITTTTNAIDQLLGKTTGLLNSAGGPVERALFGWMPGSDAFNLNANITTIEALIGFDAINDMRAAATSGASGLGQITEKELKYLQSVQGSLATLQANGQLLPTLERIRKSFQNMYIENTYGTTARSYDEIVKLKEEKGFSEDQIREIVRGESFSNVGNTSASGNLTPLGQSIVEQESGGNYAAVGIPTPHGRALGKYQIIPKFHFSKIGLDANSQADNQRFLATPQLQDALFSQILSELGAQYGGDPRKIAAAYYGGGEGASVVGTPAGDKPQAGGMPSINNYVNKVVSRAQRMGASG